MDTAFTNGAIMEMEIIQANGTVFARDPEHVQYCMVTWTNS
jgi:hypothetical protein